MNDDIRDMQDQNPARRAAGDGPTPPDFPSPGAVDGHVPTEVIAAWLDTPDDLDATERESVAAHMADCAQCLEVAAHLRGIVVALAALPQVAPPRSFSLTREMVAGSSSAGVTPAAREPIRMDQTNAWHERQYRVVRWATAVAAVLFVLVLSLDLVTNRLDPDRSAGGDAAMSVQTEMSTTGGAASDDARVAEDGEDLAEEFSEMEIESSRDEAASQSEESQSDANPSAATPASSTSDDDESAALESSSEEASGEPSDSTLAVKESEGDAEQETAIVQQSEVEAVDESSQRLRIIQVALALIVVWLLAAMIALPRVRQG